MNTKQTQEAFTPGPWIRDTPYIRNATADATVASVQDGSYNLRGPSIPHAEQVANANLIAAAPALYEAAEEALDWIEAEIRSRAHDIEADDPPLARLRAALRQARGEA